MRRGGGAVSSPYDLRDAVLFPFALRARSNATSSADSTAADAVLSEFDVSVPSPSSWWLAPVAAALVEALSNAAALLFASSASLLVLCLPSLRRRGTGVVRAVRSILLDRRRKRCDECGVGDLLISCSSPSDCVPVSGFSVADECARLPV